MSLYAKFSYPLSPNGLRAGPHSAVGSASDRRVRGTGFDTRSDAHFRGNCSWNLFYGHFDPATDSLMGSNRLLAKLWEISTDYPLRRSKPRQE